MGRPIRVRDGLPEVTQMATVATGHGSPANAHLIPAIPTTGLTWSGGIIPVVRINGTLPVLFSTPTGIDHLRTKRWDG